VDKLIIQGLEVSTIIGVRTWERRVRQQLLIDLELPTDAAKAATRDDLSEALDYGTLSRRVVGFVEASAFQLLETLAEQIAALVKREFAVSSVRVRLKKPGAIPAAAFVAIDIER
jgi:dihydroneopterin aldolase